ncbi:MAG: hypothetical protein RR234_02780 [Christensenella sp.]
MKLVCNKVADMRENVPNFEHMQYVLIPEPHIDARKQLHIHGVMRGITDTSLVDLRKVKGRKTCYITGRLKQSKHTYTSLYLQRTCGFNLFEPIEDIDRLTNYLIKMFDLAPHWRNSSKRLVYASHGLDRPSEIARGSISSEQLKRLASLAKSSYKHRSADSGNCYGESFIFDNTLENKAMLMRFFVMKIEDKFFDNVKSHNTKECHNAYNKNL